MNPWFHAQLVKKSWTVSNWHTSHNVNKWIYDVVEARCFHIFMDCTNWWCVKSINNSDVRSLAEQNKLHGNCNKHLRFWCIAVKDLYEYIQGWYSSFGTPFHLPIPFYNRCFSLFIICKWLKVSLFSEWIYEPQKAQTIFFFLCFFVFVNAFIGGMSIHFE